MKMLTSKNRLTKDEGGSMAVPQAKGRKCIVDTGEKGAMEMVGRWVWMRWHCRKLLLV